MEYRRLGDSGLEVSPLFLGTAKFGDRITEAAARRMLAIAADAGVNVIDTADRYTLGRSETIVGRLLRGQRDRWVLATKVGLPMSERPNESGLSRKWIRRAIDDSLRRLGTDYVDIYYLHRDDWATALEEPVSAMADVVRAGKARYFGLSNFLGFRIVQTVAICDRLGRPRPLVCQPYYNLADRTAENEILPACAAFGVGVASYSPLAAGVLTAKYVPGRPAPKGSRVAADDPYIRRKDYRPESVSLAQRIAEHARRRGMTAGQFAVRWILDNRLMTAVVAGPRTPEQWREYVFALDKPFDAEDEAFVDSLVATGCNAAPGFVDPTYPPRGRVPRSA